MVKTTGKEFKEFYNDPKIWKVGTYYEDEYIIVNGEEPGPDFDVEKLKDTDRIVLEGGTFYSSENERFGTTLEVVFKKWRKEKTVVYTVISCRPEKLALIKDAIKKLGGKIETR